MVIIHIRKNNTKNANATKTTAHTNANKTTYTRNKPRQIKQIHTTHKQHIIQIKQAVGETTNNFKLTKHDRTNIYIYNGTTTYIITTHTRK